MDADAAGFANRVLTWYQRYGRHDLPWQQEDAYRVWLAEIMLQQTQVNTVIPYYQKFIKHFPGINQLADASIDEVYNTGRGWVTTPAPATCTRLRELYAINTRAGFHKPSLRLRRCPE